MTHLVGKNDASRTIGLDGGRLRSGTNEQLGPLGWWLSEGEPPRAHPETIREALEALHQPVILVKADYGLAVAPSSGTCILGRVAPHGHALPIQAYLPPMTAEELGDRSFRREHGLRYAYVAGAMANGIASEDLVIALSQQGMLGFFGAAGLSLSRIEAALNRFHQELKDQPFGMNLIHSPNDPHHEAATVELYLHHNVHLVEASAYLDLTLPVLRYRLAGIRRLADGEVFTPNRIVAKVSRIEVAAKFMAPAPERWVRELVRQGHLSEEQAELARQVPVAGDVTVEADSGGHTDNRPAITLLPTIMALRDRLQREYGYSANLRVGLGGGIATPTSAAAAFGMGAAYVVTGSVNQACVESGSSDLVRQMLAEAEQADTAMAPAADMFEMGVKVQVLKRGTMFPMRALKLYELYRSYSDLAGLPSAERNSLERNIFRLSLDEVWQQTANYFQERDPEQLRRAQADSKHQMALVFRWYLGQSSRWANQGVADRKIDFQIWCGPAMGAFNEWTRGSFLELPRNRSVVTVAFNLLYGASVTLRHHLIRHQGVHLPPDWLTLRPQPLPDLLQRLGVE